MAQVQSRYEIGGIGTDPSACSAVRISSTISAQLVADLLEADGYTVYFGGGNIAHDDILAEVHERKPDVLLKFSGGSAPRVSGSHRPRPQHQRPARHADRGRWWLFNRAPAWPRNRADLWARSRGSHGPARPVPDVRADLEDRTVGRGRVRLIDGSPNEAGPCPRHRRPEAGRCSFPVLNLPPF